MPTLPRERADYSAIVDRPPLKLPGGARIVFWSIVNLEVWDIGKPMARQVLPAPTGQPMLPDVPNWSWHEYGMRVGVWRFFDLYRRLGIRPTLSINARVCEDYVRVAEEAKIPAHIFHFKIRGVPLWGTIDKYVAQIESARGRGLDITANQYPYTAMFHGWSAFFPLWIRDGGPQKFAERLKDPADKPHIMVRRQPDDSSRVRSVLKMSVNEFRVEQ